MLTYTDLLGCKFKPNGRSKDEGFDCYGLAIEVLKRNGIILHDAIYDFSDKESASKGIRAVNNVTRIEKPEINCIIEITVKGLPTHIAVYIGDGLLLHSVHNRGVIIEPIYRYKTRIVGYYKVSNGKSL